MDSYIYISCVDGAGIAGVGCPGQDLAGLGWAGLGWAETGGPCGPDETGLVLGARWTLSAGQGCLTRRDPMLQGFPGSLRQ